MKLYMDDERTHPEGWTRAHNAKEAKEAFLSGDVTFASLDHDLYLDSSRGPVDWHNLILDNYESGEDVVKWLVENNIWPSEGLRIHTDYATGRYNMAELIEAYGPYQNMEIDTNVYYPTEGPGVLFTP